MDINVALVCGIGLAALRLDGPALRGAVFFALVCLVHSELSGSMSDILYYASACAADFVALYVLYGLRPVDDTVDGLAWVCVASFVANIIGLVSWYLYYSPELYNAVLTLVYLAALVIVVKGAKGGGLGSRGFFWRATFSRGVSRAGLAYGRTDTQEKRT